MTQHAKGAPPTRAPHTHQDCARPTHRHLPPVCATAGYGGGQQSGRPCDRITANCPARLCLACTGGNLWPGRPEEALTQPNPNPPPPPSPHPPQMTKRRNDGNGPRLAGCADFLYPSSCCMELLLNSVLVNDIGLGSICCDRPCVKKRKCNKQWPCHTEVRGGRGCNACDIAPPSTPQFVISPFRHLRLTPPPPRAHLP